MDHPYERFISFVTRNAPGYIFTEEDARKSMALFNSLTLMTDENFKSMTIEELAVYADPITVYNTRNNPGLMIEQLGYKDKCPMNDCHRSAICNMAYICLHGRDAAVIRESGILIGLEASITNILRDDLSPKKT